MAKKVYTTKIVATIEAYQVVGGLCHDIIVKRQFDNIFHLKYYLEHYNDRYGEKFTIVKVLKKEKLQ